MKPGTDAQYKWLQTSYDRDAERYDEARYTGGEGQFFNELEGEVLRDWLALTADSTVMDMPAGTGRLCVSLATTGAHVVGVDISRNMLNVAAGKKNEGQWRRMQLAQGSGAQLPFPDNTFDAVVSFKFFHLIPNDLKPVLIREMARVLKPGAPLLVEFNSAYYGGVLAFLRYYFRKKRPGNMRMRCLFPDQIPTLFQGLDVRRVQGVKLPLSGFLSGLFGISFVRKANVAFGRLPVAKYLSYAVIIEARKPR